MPPESVWVQKIWPAAYPSLDHPLPPSAQVVFYGQTKGVFAGFGLDGATLKRDQSGEGDESIVILPSSFA